MNPAKLLIDQPDKLQVVANKPVKTETFFTSIKPHKGHTLFEINPFSGTCVEAVYEKTDAAFPLKNNVSVAKKRKVLTKQNHVYVSALNRKNALTKFFKMVKEQLKHIKWQQQQRKQQRLKNPLLKSRWKKNINRNLRI